jgi:DNA polymerase-3 subunit gamma/tau
MSYLVLARKYRPQIFDDVIGQEEVVQQLKGALASGRLGHAFLFCGPRGTGKTTCARILSRELNKLKGAGTEKLGLDTFLDVIEIDGASNNSVEDVRTLRENVQLVPMSGGYKVYIIDEVHMLSESAFNALLKTLEEPPEHVKFIFATTNPDKLPVTVISRCQRFNFKRIPVSLIVAKLQDISHKEHIKADEDALRVIARASQGSMRDALSVLDQLCSTTTKGIAVADVSLMFGLVEEDKLFEIAEALAARDCPKALVVLEKIMDEGKDARQLGQDLIELYRNLMVVKTGGKDAEKLKELETLLDYSKAYKEALVRTADKVSMPEILSGIDTLVKAQDDARVMESSRLALEIAFARIANSVSGVAPAPTRPAPAVMTHRPVSVSSSVPRPSSFKPTSALPKPVAAGGITKNNKGAVSIEPIPLIPDDSAAPGIKLEDVKREWHALTFAVSKKKISVGTYLQEGVPFKVEGNRVTVAFSPADHFHKECLDRPDALNLISEAFSEHFKVDVHVGLTTAEVVDSNDDPAHVQEAIKLFEGEVVNEWHSETEGNKSSS